MTPEQEFFLEKRRGRRYRIAIIIAGILLLGLLQLVNCNQQQSAVEAYNAIEDSLKKEIGLRSVAESIARGMRKDIDDMDIRNAELTEYLNITKSVLKEKDTKIGALAAAVKKANSDKDTVTLVDNCLELADSVEYWRSWLHETWQKETELDKLQNSAILATDSLARHWESAYKNCVRTLEFTAKTLPQLKPSGQLYITGGGLSNGHVFGATGGLTHISKKQLLIAGKGMLTNYGWGGAIDVGVPLRFKRSK